MKFAFLPKKSQLFLILQVKPIRHALTVLFLGETSVRDRIYPIHTVLSTATLHFAAFNCTIAKSAPFSNVHSLFLWLLLTHRL